MGKARFENTPLRTSHYQPQTQPSDVGFGYIGSHETSPGVEMPATPRSPLKSAMKSPGQIPKDLGTAKSATFNKEAMFSPTFREEKLLEREEKMTTKRQAQDLVSRRAA